MKHCLVALAALAVVGCATSDGQQRALQELRTEVREQGGDLEYVKQFLSEASAQLGQLDRELGGRLDNIENQLAKPVEIPAPVCSFPTPTPVVVETDCEVPAEAVTADSGTEKTVVGALETIRITPPGIDVIARIDTGADSNSLSATNLLFLERDGEDWVRFDFPVDDEIHTLERRVSRFVRVFQQSDTEGTRRPVVQIRAQLGRMLGDFEFNLSDRSHLKHSVILGRNMLMDLFIVDVAQEFVQPLPAGDGG